jgi:uncharacterized protein
MDLHVHSIRRYPVKSMAGEQIASSIVSNRGLLGDRVYALVDRASNKVASVRTWAASLLNYTPKFLSEPTNEAPAPPLQITLPDGRVVSSTQAEVDEILSAALGHELRITAIAPEGLLLPFPAGTLSGKFAEATEAPISAGAPPQTFFDYGTVHFIATSTIARLQAAYPAGRFDLRRFRPNIVIETDGGDGFIENSWTGRTLAFGDEVQLRVTIPCPRCVVTTLPQGDLPHDPGILKTAVQQNRLDLGDLGRLPCVGVYADVVRTGTVRQGDVVRVVN